MADLRSKFIEDYAGGLLNVSRQELASTGEVLSQDGFLSDSTLFVEDGSGTKSGLLLGTSLCEVVDPTTEQGAVNVRFADRTYASIRDLRIFSTAIASAQAALSDATSSSITNLETAFELLENAFDTLQNNFDTRETVINTRLNQLDQIDTLSAQITANKTEAESISNRVTSLESGISANVAAFTKVKNVTNISFDNFGSVSGLSPQTTAGDENRTSGNYTLTGLISSTGTGLGVTLNVDADGVVTITTVNARGINFKVGDKIIIPDSSLGGGGGATVTLIVNEVSTSMTVENLTPQVQALFDKVNELIEAFN